MSLTADRLHRGLKRIQRRCTHCGNRMRRLKYKLPPVYDGRTGKKTDRATYYWMCAIANFNEMNQQHDGGITHKPRR